MWFKPTPMRLVLQELATAWEFEPWQPMQWSWQRVGPKHQYLAGPFPFGSDRGSLFKTLKSMMWDARPMQPLSSHPPHGGHGSW